MKVLLPFIYFQSLEHTDTTHRAGELEGEVGERLYRFPSSLLRLFPSESLFLLHINKPFSNGWEVATSSLKHPWKPVFLQSQTMYSQPNNSKRALPQTAGQIHGLADAWRVRLHSYMAILCSCLQSPSASSATFGTSLNSHLSWSIPKAKKQNLSSGFVR